MDHSRVYKMIFAGVYPHYIAKAEKKGRTKAEVDQIIFWLTGYDEKSFQKQLDNKVDFETFFWRSTSIKSKCFIDKRSYLWLSRRRNRRSFDAKSALSR